MTEIVKHTIIPAEPGWAVAYLVEGKGQFLYRPVIAWGIDLMGPVGPKQYHCAEPIMAVGLQEDMDLLPWAFKRPDGKYEIPGLAIVDNEDKAIKILQREVDKENNRRA